MEQPTLESGLEDLGQTEVQCSGLTEQNMKENGEMDRLLEKENSFILMVICMKANGLIIKQMDLEHM